MKTSFEDLEDPDDASSRDTVLEPFQTVHRAVELQISHRDFEELLLEDVLDAEMENLEILLIEKQISRMLILLILYCSRSMVLLNQFPHQNLLTSS